MFSGRLNLARVLSLFESMLAWERFVTVMQLLDLGTSL